MHALVGGVAVALALIVATAGARTPAAAPAVPVDVTGTIALATGVPTASLERAAPTADARAPRRSTASAIISVDGKPSILYVGSEFCPFCASERWPVVVALSRFGTFSGLGVSHSSLTDTFPGTATLSFHGSTYTSKYLTFTGKELYDNTEVGGRYGVLDTLSPAEERRFADPIENPNHGFPFLDLGGRYLADAQYLPETLKGMTANQIATTLVDPSTRVGGLIDGSANWLTASLCTLTNDEPTTVCASPLISTLKGQLP